MIFLDQGDTCIMATHRGLDKFSYIIELASSGYGSTSNGPVGLGPPSDPEKQFSDMEIEFEAKEESLDPMVPLACSCAPE